MGQGQTVFGATIKEDEAGGVGNNMLPDEFQLNIAQQHADIPPLLARTPTATLFQPACTAIAMIQGTLYIYMYIYTYIHIHICWCLQIVFSYCADMFTPLLQLLISEMSSLWHPRDRSVSQAGPKCVCVCVELGYQQTGSCSRTMESLDTTYGIL